MQDRRIVIDANILVRAVLGVRVRELIERYSDSTAFYVAEPNVDEALKYLQQLSLQRGVTEQTWRTSFEAVMTAVQIVPTTELAALQDVATMRIGRRDPADWPAVAAALQFDCPIWTEDADFFGSGVAIWVTSTVETYLRGVSV